MREGSFISLLLIAAVVAVAASPASAQSSLRTRLASTSVCNYHDLCYTLVKQAQKVLDENGDFCTLPQEDRRHGMRRPDWRPVGTAAQHDLLERVLPLVAWATPAIEAQVKAEMPKASADQVRRAVWQRYGERVTEALDAGRGTLETARLDFDNASPKEQVYRMTRLEPVDMAKPDGPWRAVRCGSSGGGQPVPLYAVFLDEPDQRRIGSPALSSGIEGGDLFIYRSHTYIVRHGTAGLEASWVRNHAQTGRAYLSPVLDLTARVLTQ